jgi:3-deoxy-D-manno-octulosonic-acid transferase
MTINLPFSSLGIVMGDPIHVPPEAGAKELECWRVKVEAALNDATARAYALAGAEITRATPASSSYIALLASATPFI